MQSTDIHWTVTQILVPPVYIIATLVTSHVYMTLGIRQLAMFASKNRQVVQIRIRVSHVEAVVYTGEFAKTAVPVVSNPICSKIPWWLISQQMGCLWWEVAQSRFYVDLKPNFALKNNSMEFLPDQITRWVNVPYELRLKWTRNHSRLAVEEVSFLPQTQEWYSFNYNICTRCSSQH